MPFKIVVSLTLSLIAPFLQSDDLIQKQNYEKQTEIMPKYPPVKPSPTVDDCIKALRVSDYFQCGGVTVASWGYGFLVGKPARFALAGLMAGIGFTFGSMVVMQNTRGRLMGFRENDREVRIYGKADIGTIQDDNELVKRPLRWKEYN